MRQQQRGMTLIGMVCLLALVGLLLYAGIRLVPVYINYYRIVQNMQLVATEFKGDSPDIGRMRVSLDRHWSIDYISDVDAKDIEIKKEDGGVVMHVAYDKSVPYLANVSLTASFEKTVKVE